MCLRNKDTSTLPCIVWKINVCISAKIKLSPSCGFIKAWTQRFRSKRNEDKNSCNIHLLLFTECQDFDLLILK